MQTATLGLWGRATVAHVQLQGRTLSGMCTSKTLHQCIIKDLLKPDLRERSIITNTYLQLTMEPQETVPPQMIQGTNLTTPQVFLIYGGEDADIPFHSQMLVKDFKLSPISIADLSKTQVNRGGVLSQQIANALREGLHIEKEIIVRLVKKEIAINGCRRYLIVDFPRRIEVFQELKKSVGDQVHIKKVILVSSEKERAGISQDLREYIAHMEKQDMIVRVQQLKLAQTAEDLKCRLKSNNILPPPLVDVFFVSGGPGSGKGTQCANLVKDYGFKHLSTGDLLREAITKGSKEGIAIDNCLKNGQLVSSDLLVDLIRSEIARNNYMGKYLIDGFPRSVENDQVWTKLMVDEAKLSGLIYMQCNEDTMYKRLMERAKTSNRSDDNIDTIKKRFKVFNKETEPIISKYKNQNNVININAELTPEEVYAQLRGKLETKGLKPNDSKGHVNQPGVILVLGGPGSGKGTQCANLVRQFGFIHLSTGDLLRDEQKQHGLNSELIQDYIKEGKLVPSKILVRLIKKAMVNKGWDGVYLLDGFPRNVQNIEAWESEIGNEVSIRHTIMLNCSQKVMEGRLLERDDNPDSITKRFRTFQSETAPIIARYQQDHRNIIVDAEQEIQKVFEDLRKALLEKGYKPL